MKDDYDLPRARALLGGFVRQDKPGCWYHHFLDDELRAREAIARILRSDLPLNRDIRNSLASLFDPQSTNWRRLKFEFRSTARRTDYLRDSSIAVQVYQVVKAGHTTEKAWQIVGDKFALSPDIVKKVWARYKRYKRYF